MSFLRPRAIVAGFAAIALSAAAISATAAPASGVATADASASTRTVSGGHFSNPQWLMFREPALVSSTFHNPGGGHKRWALDFIGRQGQGVYAAGWGIAHVGGRAPACRGGGGDSNLRGNWVWIDHGGATSSYYFHLDGISISDGQQVSPDTQIGTMGVSGGVGCSTYQLHFEVLINHDQVNPGSLYACQGGSPITQPQAIGYSSWSDVPRDKVSVTSSGSNCRGAQPEISAPSSESFKKRGTKATVSWPAVGGAQGYWVSWQKQGKGVAKRTTNYAKTGGTSLTISKLNRYGKYKVKVCAFDENGNSPWQEKTLNMRGR